MGLTGGDPTEEEGRLCALAGALLELLRGVEAADARGAEEGHMCV